LIAEGEKNDLTTGDHQEKGDTEKQQSGSFTPSNGS